MENREWPAELRIYDPREGEEFTFGISADRTLSSLDLEMLVMVYDPKVPRRASRPPSLRCDELNEFIVESILRTGEKGFVTQSPLTRDTKDLPGGERAKRYVVSGSAIEYFPLSRDEIQSRFDQRRRLASYEEWSVGSCAEEFTPIVESSGALDRATFWNAAYIWTEPEKIGAMSVYNGDTGTLFALTRLYPDIDLLLEERGRGLA